MSQFRISLALWHHRVETSFLCQLTLPLPQLFAHSFCVRSTDPTLQQSEGRSTDACQSASPLAAAFRLVSRPDLPPLADRGGVACIRIGQPSDPNGRPRH